MPSQYFTVVKIGGAAADVVVEKFRSWLSAQADGDELSSEQWPADVRKEVDQLADDLRQHAHELPILFHAEHVDLWSMHPIASLPLDLVMGDRQDVMVLELPLSEQLVSLLQQRRRHGQWDESRFFATTILTAAAAWEKLVDNAVLVIVRRVVGGLVSDDDVLNSLKRIPNWFYPR